MYKIHRNGDGRACGAVTTVLNQSTVYANDKLIAVLGSTNNHGAGNLINSTGDTVFIEDKPIIVHGPDHANPDGDCPFPPDHCDPYTTSGSDNVFGY